MSEKLYIALTVLLLTTGVADAQKIHPDRDLSDYCDKGYELYDAGSYRAAMAEFKKATVWLTPDNGSEAMSLDYHIAECAGKLGDSDAMSLFDAFMLKYPNSSYSNDVRFAKANILYLRGNYANARQEYLEVSRFDLRTSQQDEYNFKLGHSLFENNDYQNARSTMQQVGRGGDYSSHARYYIAYMDYTEGRYADAKREFTQLANHPSYEKVIPYYLLQIEFLEGNYDYVVANADALMKTAVGEREIEIARIIAESWFHKKDYNKAINYLSRYRDAGGRMGRTENYLLGYSYYMQNDIGDAIESLVQVVGPDDKLTQNAAYHLGGCYLRSGDKFKAMQSFSMASGADYDASIREDALFNYGKLQYELGGSVFNEAINILNRYIAEYPDSPRVGQAREYLVAAYYNSRNYEAAYEAIKLVPNPDNNIKTAYQKISYFRALEYYNAGDYEMANRLLEESLQNRFNPKYTALTQFWKGEILYRQGNYRKAIPLFREYVSLSPALEDEHKTALYDLGYCYFNLQQWAESRSWFDRFLAAYSAQDSYRADALNRTADARYVVREFPQAMANYEAAARIGTDERYYANYQRAVIQGLTGSRDKKIESLRGIISAGEGAYVSDAMYELGRTYIVAERFSDAAATLKRYVSEYHDGEKNLAALSSLGLAYQNMNDNQSALKYYKDLVVKAPSSPEARDAMMAAKSIYVDMNNVDGYFAFARTSGVETDMSAVARDSLSFAAAERVYLGSANRRTKITTIDDYLHKFPRGVYRANALFYVSDLYIAEKQYDEAINGLTELGGMHYNSFTVRGLEKLAPLCFERKRYVDAAAAYKRLASVAVNPETTEVAYTGYLKSVKAEGDNDQIITAADDIIVTKAVPAAVLRDALFAKANALNRQGRGDEALTIYRQLGVEAQSAEGAESTYRVIEMLYASGDTDGAEKLVLRLAGENSPYPYWLGKAFLTLGDIYISKGDNFQARATLQSVIDGYSPADDGIIDAAKRKIAELGDQK